MTPLGPATSLSGESTSADPMGAPDAQLQDIVESARRSFPTIQLPVDVFLSYLRERLPSGVTEPAGLRQLYTADLYIACACAHGDPNAVAVFEDRCLTRLDRVLARMGIDADTSAEVKQDIRSRLFAGNGQPSEIASFMGRGDLRGWVRVMAVRKALRRKIGARREVPVEDSELLQRIIAPGDPELDHAKRAYREAFQRAFGNALRALPDRENTLLRQHYLDGLNLDQLAILYRVHRATAARMLSRARVVVLAATRAELRMQLDVQSEELDSILRMIRSQIEVSLQDLKRRRRR
jgi:RNA polymerase sigma-70 factor, ECF subfamily